MENKVADKNITPREFIDRYRDFLREDGALSYERLFTKMHADLFYPLTSCPDKDELPAMWDATLQVFRDYDNLRKSYEMIKDKEEFKEEFAFDRKRIDECSAILKKSGIVVDHDNVVILPMSKVGDYFTGVVMMVQHRKKSFNDGEDWKASLSSGTEGTEFRNKIAPGVEVIYTYASNLELEGHKFHLKNINSIEAIVNKKA